MSSEAGKQFLALFTDAGMADPLDVKLRASVVAAIEAEAVAARNAEIAEAVRALPNTIMNWPGDDTIYRTAVLALVEKP